jgi:hypothetical protein
MEKPIRMGFRPAGAPGALGAAALGGFSAGGGLGHPASPVSPTRAAMAGHRRLLLLFIVAASLLPGFKLYPTPFGLSRLKSLYFQKDLIFCTIFPKMEKRELTIPSELMV